jgi:DNA-directed RNA polymerase subunit RPC12/RpoP
MARLTVEQVLSMRKALKRPGNWIPWDTVSLLLVILALLIGLMIFSGTEGADWPDTVGIPIGLAALAGGITVIALLAVSLRVARRRFAARIGACCPSCGTMMDFPLALASGRCGACGAEILDRADRYLAVGPPWTCDQFAALYGRNDRSPLRIVVLITLGRYLVFPVLPLAGVLLTALSDGGLAFLFFGAWLFYLLVPRVAVRLIERRRLRRLTGSPTLACPFCKADLNGPGREAIVMATGRCGECGHRLFALDPDGGAAAAESRAAPDAETAAKAAAPHQERRQAAESLKAAGKLYTVAFVVGMLAIFAATFPLIYLVKHMDLSIEQWWGNLGMLLVSLSAGLVIALLFLRRVRRYHAAGAAVACPACKRKSLVRGFTLATGRCPYCGGRVLADD